MSRYDQLKKKKTEAFRTAHQEVGNLNMIAQESRRVANLAHNAGDVITDLDRQFAAATKLTSRDIEFLFLATALQCTRWILMPEFEFKNSEKGENATPISEKAQEIKESGNSNEPKDSDNAGEREPYTWQQLLMSPVPYLCDITEVADSENSVYGQLFGKDDSQEIGTVWGEDPLFGWVFGTLNILSRTVTLRTMNTYDVVLDEMDQIPLIMLGKEDLRLVADSEIDLTQMLNCCWTSLQEDPKRMLAAIAKQASVQFAKSPERFGVSIPWLLGNDPDELINNVRRKVRWAKEQKEAWDERLVDGTKEKEPKSLRDYSSMAFAAYESVQEMAEAARETIDGAENMLDGMEGMEQVMSFMDKAKSAIQKMQECMNKPQETFGECTETPMEYIATAQAAISATREYMQEAQTYIRQASEWVVKSSAVGSSVDGLFDKANSFLDSSAGITDSLQSLFSSPQELITRIEELAENGWNRYEKGDLAQRLGKDLAIVGLQAGISVLINSLIRALHTMCYNEALDGDQKLYEVRTRKILSYSNLIASGSNVLYVALSKNIKKLDIGGIAVTIYRLVTDHCFIQEVKREFLSKQWYDMVMGDDEIYQFLDEG